MTQIGLLRPETVTDAGYRLYGEKDMERLSQILFFRELDFPLSQIKEMLDSLPFDRNEALRAQHELLKKEGAAGTSDCPDGTKNGRRKRDEFSGI